MTEENSLTEIDLHTGFQKLLRYWWILAVVIILGGVLGWLISLLQPPVYEATTFYLVDLDEQEIVERNLLPDIASLDYATANTYLMPLVNIFFSSDTQSELFSTAAQNGISIQPDSFGEPEFHLDRRGQLWFVVVRNQDPEIAAFLANSWLEIVDKRAQSQLIHAIAAEDMQTAHELVSDCFADNSFKDANLCAGTGFQTLADLDDYLKTLRTGIQLEQEKSGGLQPVFTASVSERAKSADTPILYRRGLLIVTGCMLGLVLDFLFIPIFSRKDSG